MMLSSGRCIYKHIHGVKSSSRGCWPIRDNLWHTRWRHCVRALIEWNQISSELQEGNEGRFSKSIKMEHKILFLKNKKTRQIGRLVFLLLFLYVVLQQLDVTDLSLLYSSVGGEIQSLAWDPTGERLAVLLKGCALTLSNQISFCWFILFLK